MTQPAIDAPQHDKARWWREDVMDLSRKQLAALTGVSVSRIADMEAGKTRGNGKPIDPGTMRRYRMACAAVALGAEFDWLTLRLRPSKATIIVEMHDETDRQA